MSKRLTALFALLLVLIAGSIGAIQAVHQSDLDHYCSTIGYSKGQPQYDPDCG